jgi:hypothetical protein
MSSSGKLRIILDSTYLLPIVGIGVEDVDEALLLLKRLRDEDKAEYYYSPFSLLEILGKLSRLKCDQGRVSAGLTSIGEEFKLAHPTAEGYLKALVLRAKGYRDIIDLLLYATSLTADKLLLTRDRALIEFLRENHEDVKNILREEELLEKYGQL